MDMTRLLNQLVLSVKTDAGSHTRLRMAADTAENLSWVADSLLGHFVDEARTEGRSWSQIGAELGMTKQGAQQRFSPAWASRLAGFSGRLSPRSQQVLVNSQRLATLNGADIVAVDHLLCAALAGFVDQFGTICSKRLTLDDFAGAFNLQLGTELTRNGREPARFSRPCMELMSLAVAALPGNDAQLVEPAHFIAGAIDSSINTIEPTISSLGITWTNFRSEINRHV